MVHFKRPIVIAVRIVLPQIHGDLTEPYPELLLLLHQN